MSPVAPNGAGVMGVPIGMQQVPAILLRGTTTAHIKEFCIGNFIIPLILCVFV